MADGSPLRNAELSREDRDKHDMSTPQVGSLRPKICGHVVSFISGATQKSGRLNALYVYVN